MIRSIVLPFLLLTQPAAALELALPATARLTVERNTAPDIYTAPVGVFDGEVVPKLTIEGDVRRAAWRLDSSGITPLQVMRPLREQLQDNGYEIVLDCAGDACGGFDFRFATETLPGPNMYVNIRAYHMVTAVKPATDAPSEVITVLASTSATSAYVQIIHAGELSEGAVDVAAVADVPVSRSAEPGDISGELLGRGHFVLRDLEFETGSADLGTGPFATLSDLADFLKAQPGIKVALVGHTDSVGGLAGNIALSKRRAQSVRQRLIDAYEIDGARMEAEGMGYLSPVASNLEDKGRDANRRVEVILLRAE
ncbi:OmpA family protein [Sulfitobacter aestuariivivens]|uniref:OmpA family protein n=1 Tax=Sulfitobacter aestuariivivens TaxID=2766981 RepID=A0A927D6R2_9RHOB|nr:OmpA family protein [Sulfitobacter aestuariivivens]MBD3664829.1 OmpA family protein [Sulfitobacter aestuariivivens]